MSSTNFAEDTFSELRIDLVIFTINGCLACSALVLKVEKILADQLLYGIENVINLHVLDHGEEITFLPARLVQPRGFPTVIAYRDGIATLGWEGFAMMAPNEIQEHLVLEVIRQIDKLLMEKTAQP
jgi:hypothetical protein